MDFGLSGRVAAVAASSSGLGKSVAFELAREGAAVAICSRDRTRADVAATSIRETVMQETGVAPRVHSVVADLASEEGPANFIRSARDALGSIDILVANNGGPPPGPVLGLGDDAWRAGFELTFESSRKLAEAVIDEMRSRKWGRIVFISSTSVKQSIPGLAISTAMRSAVVGFAKSVANEVAIDGVTVNTAAPGSTATDRLQSIFEKRAAGTGASVEEIEAKAVRQIPMGRVGRPDEFAAAVAFLCSERAGYITGVVLPIDGGLVRSLT